jgi:hypothetical protein
MFEKTGDRWEDKFEGLPGFGLVVAIVAVLLAWWSGSSGETVRRESNPLIAVAIAYLLYRTGSVVDDLLFKTTYEKRLEKPHRWLSRWDVLYRASTDAAKSLNCPITGLYAKAEGILKGTEEWQNQVKPKMDGSKAARSFIIPSLVIFAAQYFQLRLPHFSVPQWLEPDHRDHFGFCGARIFNH